MMNVSMTGWSSSFLICTLSGMSDSMVLLSSQFSWLLSFCPIAQERSRQTPNLLELLRVWVGDQIQHPFDLFTYLLIGVVDMCLSRNLLATSILFFSTKV